MADLTPIYEMIGVCIFVGVMIGGFGGVIFSNLYIKTYLKNKIGITRLGWGRLAVGRVHSSSGLIREYAFDETKEIVELKGRAYWPKRIGYVERKFGIPIYEFFEGETGGAQYKPVAYNTDGTKAEPQPEYLTKLVLETSTDKPISSSAVAAAINVHKENITSELVNKNQNQTKLLLIIILISSLINVLLGYLAMNNAGNAIGVCQQAIQVVQQAAVKK